MRSRCARRRIGHVSERVCLKLELEVADPIKGRVREAGKADLPFLGWLQLLSALEAVCDRMRGSEPK